MKAREPGFTNCESFVSLRSEKLIINVDSARGVGEILDAKTEMSETAHGPDSSWIQKLKCHVQFML